MTNGRHVAPRKGHSRALIVFVSLVLIVALSIGGTMAWLVDDTTPVENNFTPGVVSCEVKETFSGEEKSNVSIKNTGNINAYIRVAIVVTWKDSEGNVYGQSPVAGTDYTMNLNLKEYWLCGSDGYYYYKYPVEPGQTTNVLISYAAPGSNVPVNYYLDIAILADAIQSVPTTTVSSVWPVSVGADGRLS